MYTCSRICKFTQVHPHAVTCWHPHNSTHTHTCMVHLWLALAPYYISPHSGGRSIFTLIFLLISGVPDYIWIWNCRCQYPSDSSDWPSLWTTSEQNWPFLCVLFTFRHCGAFTGEGEIATTATRWHTQAEGNGLCSSLILKITFWKGGGRHDYLLQPRGFMLTERRDLRVLTEVKLNEKKQ